MEQGDAARPLRPRIERLGRVETLTQREISASEVAETLGYDRSTVTRYLNDSVGLGLLQRFELNREGGDVVNVYHSIDLKRMRRETLVGFLLWAGEAGTLIEEANLTKRDPFEENTDHQLPDVFWKAFSDN